MDLWSRRDFRPLVEVLFIFAAKGVRWNPRDKHCYRDLRKGLSRAGSADTIEVLSKLVRAGFFTQPVFKELVSTPRMKELLSPGSYGATPLREFAGFAGAPKAKKATNAIAAKLKGRSPFEERPPTVLKCRPSLRPLPSPNPTIRRQQKGGVRWISWQIPYGLI